MNQLREHALKYASLGYRVFPLAAGQKIPCTPHGVKDATNDEDEIRRWWAKWPNANIAVACGADSGIYVIDVDVSALGDINGLESLKEFPTLPDTICQDTPRGGFHAFYKSDDPPANRNSFRLGIDIRGTGFYVVLSPSIHPNGGHYVWRLGCAPWDRPLAEYPDFMRPVVRAPWASAQCQAGQEPTVASHTYYNDDTLRRASMYLAQCDPAVQGCAGHDKLLWAAVAMVHGFLLSDGQAYDILVREYNPRCVPPWDLSVQRDEKDFRRKVSEARKLVPQNQPGWLLNESDYATSKCEINIDSLLKGNLQTDSQGAERGRTLDNVVSGVPEEHPVGPEDYLFLNANELQFLTKPTGLLGELCSWINATSIKEQPFLSLACALSFLGVLFGRKIKDALGSRTNLYCMGVAASSAGKAHAMNQVRRLCLDSCCTFLLGGDDIASDSAIEDRISRSPSTLFLWDEIGHLLAHIKSGVSKHHAQVVSLLMKLYSAAGNVYSGREYADKDRQRTIIQPCCCIYGTSTTERFTSGVSPEELQDGWLSRCMVFFSPDNPAKKRGRYEIPVPGEIIEQVRKWASRKFGESDNLALSQFVGPGYTEAPPAQLTIDTTQDAESIFVSFDNECVEYGKGHPQLACMWAKGEENARRIALIVSAGENFDGPVISAENADYSCRLVRYLLMDFRKNIVPEIVSSESEKNKRKIYTIIERSGSVGCIKRDLARSSRWAGVKQRNDLLADLLESGEIAFGPVGKTFVYWTADNFIKSKTNKTVSE